MDVSRLLFIAAAALALDLAIPAAQAQDKDAASAQAVRAPGPPKPMGPPKPWREVRGFGRVLDLSKPPVVIDEPGLYAIQRNWMFPPAVADVTPELIQITADEVTLDLHGFEISSPDQRRRASYALRDHRSRGRSPQWRSGGAVLRRRGCRAQHRRGPRLHHLRIVFRSK